MYSYNAEPPIASPIYTVLPYCVTMNPDGSHRDGKSVYTEDCTSIRCVPKFMQFSIVIHFRGKILCGIWMDTSCHPTDYAFMDA